MTPESIGISEAKRRLSEVVNEVQLGKRLTITRHGRPVAEIGPTTFSAARPKRGMAKSDAFRMSSDFDAPLPGFERNS